MIIQRTCGVNPRLYKEYNFEDHIWKNSPTHKIQLDLFELSRFCIKIDNSFWMRKIGTGHWIELSENSAKKEAKNTWTRLQLRTGTVVDNEMINTFFSGVYKYEVGESEISEQIGSCPNLYGRLVVPMGPQFLTYRNQHYLNAWYDDMIAPKEENLAVGKLILLMCYGALCNGKVDVNNINAEADRVYNMIVSNQYDDNKEFKFLIMWLAALAQQPGVNLLTNVWLLGELEGLGKGTLVAIMGIILGKGFVGKLNQQEVERGWTDFLIGLQLVESNEFDTSKERFWANWIKGNTIEPELHAMIRAVGGILVPHIGNFIFTGNVVDQKTADANNRRDQFIQTTNDPFWVGFARNVQLTYFKPDPDAVASGFAYILYQVLVDEAVISRSFKNELRDNIVTGNQNIIDEWFEGDDTLPWNSWTSAKELYEEYFAKWFQRSRIGNVIGPSQSAWGKLMGKNKRVMKNRKTKGFEYHITSSAPVEIIIPSIEEMSQAIGTITGTLNIPVVIDMDMPTIVFEPTPLSKMDRIRAELRKQEE